MAKPNGSITLTKEEAEGLVGLRARVAALDRLEHIHGWLVLKNGEMSTVQIAARINYGIGCLVENAVAGDAANVEVNVTEATIWLIHLAGQLNFDLIAGILRTLNENPIHVPRQEPV